MATQHKRYGSSTADRTIGCPNWQNICDEYAPPIERESVHAARGTMLHDIMEKWMVESGLIEEFEPYLDSLNADDAQACRDAARMVIEVLDSYGIEDIAIETFLEVDEDVGGTPDVLGWTDTHFVNIDYKFGHGAILSRSQFLFGFMAVEEGELHKEHEQLRAAMDNKLLVSVVIQPALDDKPMIEPHDWEELSTFTDNFYASLEIADHGGTQGNPGDWCKFCPAAGRCPAQREKAKAFLELKPEVDEDLAEAMKLVGAIEEHVRAVQAECFASLKSGREVPGWKLVEKQARRHWKDEAAALKQFKASRKVKGSIYLDESLRSPPQVEKALKAAGVDYDFAELVTKKSSGLTIAPENDKREAVAVTAPDALNNIMDGGQ